MTDAIPASAHPFEEPALPGEPRLDGLARLVAVVDRLRAPEGGCPWDLKQDATTLTASLLEEAFEVVEAIENRAVPSPDTAKKASAESDVALELGDLLMNLVLIARCEQDAGHAHLGDAASAVADKLIRRHPHVFGNTTVDGVEDILTNWEAIKKEERAEREADTSALAGVPTALPALQRAARLSGKAISAGFRWHDSRGALAKIAEELAELEEAFGDGAEPDKAQRAQLEAELGDLLMATAIFGRYAKLDPERALRQSLHRFEARYRHMEAALDGSLEGRPLGEMMTAWEAAKADLD
jgi:ATP diphosphatase